MVTDSIAACVVLWESAARGGVFPAALSAAITELWHTV